MINNITTFITKLFTKVKAEKDAGNQMAEQLVERLDAHIRDLETTKVWIRDRAKIRDTELADILGDEPKVAAPTMQQVVDQKDESE
jgi:hypothetical protein